MNEINNNKLWNSSFIGLFIATMISLVGDQLVLIALPWLVMTITSDYTVLAKVLVLAGIPRTLFILLGGALSDLFDAKKCLFYSRFISFIFSAVFAYWLCQGEVSLNFVYIYAFIMGLCNALGMPAGAAILPRILSKINIQKANGLSMAMTQLIVLFVPVLSGYILYLFSSENNVIDMQGFALIFLLDSITFLMAAVFVFFLIRLNARSGGNESDRRIFYILADGVRYLRSDKPLLRLMTYIGLINLCMVGTVSFGVPLLVKHELGGGAFDYSRFMFFQGVGMFISMVLSSKVKFVDKNHLIPLILILHTFTGALMVLFVNITGSFILMNAILFVVGLMLGFIGVNTQTLVQKRSEEKYLGRMMSYYMFIVFGIAPLSVLLASTINDFSSITRMFEVIGVAISVLAISFMFSKEIKKVAVD